MNSLSAFCAFSLRSLAFSLLDVVLATLWVNLFSRSGDSDNPSAVHLCTQTLVEDILVGVARAGETVPAGCVAALESLDELSAHCEG